MTSASMPGSVGAQPSTRPSHRTWSRSGAVVATRPERLRYSGKRACRGHRTGSVPGRDDRHHVGLTGRHVHLRSRQVESCVRGHPASPFAVLRGSCISSRTTQCVISAAGSSSRRRAVGLLDCAVPDPRVRGRHATGAVRRGRHRAAKRRVMFAAPACGTTSAPRRGAARRLCLQSHG